MKTKTSLFFLTALIISLGFSKAFAEADAAKQEAHFGFKELQALIEDRQIETVDQLIPLLPESLRGNYTLMKKSSSLQSSTPDHPRAILFGDTGQLILTFNGASNQSGFAAIETAEFDKETQRILFREIFFKKHLAKKPTPESLELAPEEVILENSRVLISDANPMKCMGCHTDRPEQQEIERSKRGKDRLAKYIWPQYNLWPEAHGENGDLISLPRDADFFYLQRSVKNASKVQTSEGH